MWLLVGCRLLELAVPRRKLWALLLQQALAGLADGAAAKRLPRAGAGYELRVEMEQQRHPD
jgi:hypothetical protein